MAMRSGLARLLQDDRGATAIEYALLAGLIATVIIGAVASLGEALAGFYGGTNTELVTYMQEPPAPGD
jgi:pilus assembly protein Flp/PilA